MRFCLLSFTPPSPFHLFSLLLLVVLVQSPALYLPPFPTSSSLSLVWYPSVQPLPSAPTSFSPPSFLRCVFLVATHVSLVRFSSLPSVGQALTADWGTPFEMCQRKRLQSSQLYHLSMMNKSVHRVLHRVFKSHSNSENGKNVYLKRESN